MKAIRLYEGDEFFDEILSMIEYVDGSNNYSNNVIDLYVGENRVEAETSCQNEYGSIYSNNDRQELPFSQVMEILDMENNNKTYDIHFNDSNDSNNEGFSYTIEECMLWIESNRNDSSTYFGDYKGGTVSIVCNETGEEVYSEIIR